MVGQSLLHISNHVNTGTNGGRFDNYIGNSGAGKIPHAISVRHITLGHLFNNINEHNRSMTLTYNGGTTTVTRSLPVGQYDLTQLIAQLASVWPELTFSDVPRSTSQTVDNHTNVLVSSGAGAAFTMPVSLQYEAGGLLEMLGFTANVAITAFDTNSTSNVPRNIGGVRQVFIHSRRLGHGNSMHYDGRTNNVIETIDLSSTPYGSVAMKQIDDPVVNMISFHTQEELSDVDIYLTDERMRPLTLAKNQPFDIVIRVLHKEKGE